MSLISVFDPDVDDYSWKWSPPAKEMKKGWWTRCTCDCHRFPKGTVMHVMACCSSGWKLSFAGHCGRERRRKAAERLKRMQNRRAALTYKPVHGGYPSA